LSQYEHGQIVGASWTFNINGKYSFIFNTMNMNWTLIDPEAGGIMDKWKEDEQLIKDLKTISRADCRHWLKELLRHHKEKSSRLKMLQRSCESSSGTTTLPSISLHQMNQDAADSISGSFTLCSRLGPFLSPCTLGAPG
ncbi:hypothetical protein U0070_002954, partial [Myodes glareolus]